MVLSDAARLHAQQLHALDDRALRFQGLVQRLPQVIGDGVAVLPELRRGVVRHDVVHDVPGEQHVSLAVGRAEGVVHQRDVLLGNAHLEAERDDHGLSAGVGIAGVPAGPRGDGRAVGHVEAQVGVLPVAASVTELQRNERGGEEDESLAHGQEIQTGLPHFAQIHVAREAVLPHGEEAHWHALGHEHHCEGHKDQETQAHQHGGQLLSPPAGRPSARRRPRPRSGWYSPCSCISAARTLDALGGAFWVTEGRRFGFCGTGFTFGRLRFGAFGAKGRDLGIWDMEDLPVFVRRIGVRERSAAVLQYLAVLSSTGLLCRKWISNFESNTNIFILKLD
eukprot:scaffold2269_cov221-Pinguiococcus_pyrenoidosus.AAC.15